jgi:hypothetical protein
MTVLKIPISQPWHAFSILVRINSDAYACDCFRSCGQQWIPNCSAYIVLAPSLINCNHVTPYLRSQFAWFALGWRGTYRYSTGLTDILVYNQNSLKHGVSLLDILVYYQVSLFLHQGKVVMMYKGMEISLQWVVEILENFMDYVLPLVETQPTSTKESSSEEMYYHLAFVCY